MTAWIAILIAASGVCLTILVNAIVFGRYIGRQDVINRKVLEIDGKLDKMSDKCDFRMGVVGNELKRVEIKFAAKTGDASNGG